ncbi:MAG: hypothetical protein GDA36_03005 [Rhodobacteraceae bacterium]|nr:hypothetical protein [Paracoccaceae bacterium]
MFGGSFDRAILSGPLALHRAKRFWWSGYVIAGVCGLRGGSLQVLPDCRYRQSGVFLANLNYRAARHRGIGIAQFLKRRLEIRLPPRFSRARRGRSRADDRRLFA